MKQLFSLTLLSFSIFSFSQVGLGTTSPNASAALDISSITGGLLPPRMTYVQKTAMLTPNAGLQIWCIDCGNNGEMQVFNGTVWTNISGSTQSFAKPSAPISPVATAINSQASIAFTVSALDGGSAITGYTVTSSPGSFTATGTTSPLVFTNLKGGISYTFTVVATNAAGNSVNSATSTLTTLCGGYVSSGVWKRFSCYNLGSDTSLDPNIPVQAIHGNYYQWGRNTVVANASTAPTVISGWSNTNAANGAWVDGNKTANDPCPTGYRVPTSSQWSYLLSNNTISRTGSWSDDRNFTTAISFGTSTGVSLTLPTAGYRRNSDGILWDRGYYGYYWSSTESNSIYASCFHFGNSSIYLNNDNRPYGFSVRCISE